MEANVKQPNKPIQVYVPPDVLAEIDRLADRETISRTAFIRRMLVGVTRGLNGAAA
jgi:hypothetical protein